MIENSLAMLVMKFFADLSKVEEINDTSTTLIPKNDMAHNMKNFRPISLYNVTYKILTKIFAKRLRHNAKSCSLIGSRRRTREEDARGTRFLLGIDNLGKGIIPRTLVLHDFG
ncbi:hypothetical protein CR513_56401, partial [Mucuna pruriens]